MHTRIMLKLLSLVLAAATLLFVLLSTPLSEGSYMTFAQYKKLYNLHFDSVFEYMYRQTAYNQNLAKIIEHNSQKNSTYKMGINQFTYLTHREFVHIYLGFSFTSSTNISIDQSYLDTEEFDWVSRGAITKVKTQGNCGSCWAFSTTGSVEGLSKIGYGNLQSFSQQQLVDCSSSYGNDGCNRGTMQNAFKYIKFNGIITQTLYPYKGVKGTCIYNVGSFRISGYGLASGCAAIVNGLMKNPISVGVDATNWSPYKEGIFSNCGQTALNHGVLMVGISKDYWLVKNSWGVTWGMGGYIKLARGNTCGVCNQGSYPLK